MHHNWSMVSSDGNLSSEILFNIFFTSFFFFFFSLLLLFFLPSLLSSLVCLCLTCSGLIMAPSGTSRLELSASLGFLLVPCLRLPVVFPPFLFFFPPLLVLLPSLPNLSSLCLRHSPGEYERPKGPQQPPTIYVIKLSSNPIAL